MEGLVVLLGELAAGLIVPAVMAIVELVAAAIALAAELIGWRRRRRATKRGMPTPPRRAPRWVRFTLRGALVVVFVSVAALAVVDMLFFDPLARFALRRISERSGIAIEVESIDGSLWSARARLSGVRISRGNHPTSDFDLEAEDVEVDVSARELLLLRVRIESVTGAEVTGNYARIAAPERVRPRRRFEVGRLVGRAIDVHIEDRTRGRPVAARLEIDRLVASPFRSRAALFDLLFRSDIDGRIDGRGLRVTSGPTRWRLDRLPIALVAPYLPGPLGWLDEGTVSVAVDGDLRRATETNSVAFLLDCDVDFRDIGVSVPKEVGLTKRLLFKPVVAFVEHRTKYLPLAFDMKLDRDSIEASASPEAAGLLRAFGDGLLGALAKNAGVTLDTAKKAAGKARGVLDGVKRMWPNKRGDADRSK